MLSESTNVDDWTTGTRPAPQPVVKTFARRGKKGDDSSAKDQHEQQTSTSSPTPAATLASTSTQFSARQLSDPEVDSYAWLRLRSNRRSSLLLTQPGSQGGLTSLAQHHATGPKGKAGAQQRAKSVLQVIQEMVQHYNEVDAFELVEESPEKETKAPKPKARALRGRHPKRSDKHAVVPHYPAPAKASTSSGVTATPAATTPQEPGGGGTLQQDIPHGATRAVSSTKPGTVPPHAALAASPEFSQCTSKGTECPLLPSPVVTPVAVAAATPPPAIPSLPTLVSATPETAATPATAPAEPETTTAAEPPPLTGGASTVLATAPPGQHTQAVASTPAVARIRGTGSSVMPDIASVGAPADVTSVGASLAGMSLGARSHAPTTARTQLQQAAWIQAASEEIQSASGGKDGTDDEGDDAETEAAGELQQGWDLLASSSGSSSTGSWGSDEPLAAITTSPGAVGDVTPGTPTRDDITAGAAQQWRHHHQAARTPADIATPSPAQASFAPAAIPLASTPPQVHHRGLGPRSVHHQAVDEVPSELVLPETDSTTPLSGLQQLLVTCGQDPEASLLPTMTEFLSRLVADMRKVVKVGEGSYGEAFKHGRTVFKVIPIDGSMEMNGAPQKRSEEVCPEAVVALALSRLREHRDAQGQAVMNCTSGFVETYQVGVCRGPYAPALVRAWERWDEQHASENDPVDLLSSENDPDQRFLVIAMSDCGTDLEKANLKNYDQARSIIAQVVFALAAAESAYEFEHRDLHWGNIMVRPTAQPWLTCRIGGRDIQLASCGLEAAIIDFTASRLCSAEGALVYCDLSQDEGLFQGPEDVTQFDTYRWMRQALDNDWQVSCPATNCLWIAYLADTLLGHKMGKCGAVQKRHMKEFRKRAAMAASCQDLMEDVLFDGLWEEVAVQ